MERARNMQTTEYSVSSYKKSRSKVMRYSTVKILSDNAACPLTSRGQIGTEIVEKFIFRGVFLHPTLILPYQDGEVMDGTPQTAQVATTVQHSARFLEIPGHELWSGMEIYQDHSASLLEKDTDNINTNTWSYSLNTAQYQQASATNRQSVSLVSESFFNGLREKTSKNPVEPPHEDALNDENFLLYQGMLTGHVLYVHLLSLNTENKIFQPVGGIPELKRSVRNPLHAQLECRKFLDNGALSILCKVTLLESEQSSSHTYSKEYREIEYSLFDSDAIHTKIAATISNKFSERALGRIRSAARKMDREDLRTLPQHIQTQIRTAVGGIFTKCFEDTNNIIHDTISAIAELYLPEFLPSNPVGSFFGKLTFRPFMSCALSAFPTSTFGSDFRKHLTTQIGQSAGIEQGISTNEDVIKTAIDIFMHDIAPSVCLAVKDAIKSMMTSPFSGFTGAIICKLIEGNESTVYDMLNSFSTGAFKYNLIQSKLLKETKEGHYYFTMRNEWTIPEGVRHNEAMILKQLDCFSKSEKEIILGLIQGDEEKENKVPIILTCKIIMLVLLSKTTLIHHGLADLVSENARTDLVFDKSKLPTGDNAGYVDEQGFGLGEGFAFIINMFGITFILPKVVHTIANELVPDFSLTLPQLTSEILLAKGMLIQKIQGHVMEDSAPFKNPHLDDIPSALQALYALLCSSLISQNMTQGAQAQRTSEAVLTKKAGVFIRFKIDTLDTFTKCWRAMHFVTLLANNHPCRKKPIELPLRTLKFASRERGIEKSVNCAIHELISSRVTHLKDALKKCMQISSAVKQAQDKNKSAKDIQGILDKQLETIKHTDPLMMFASQFIKDIASMNPCDSDDINALNAAFNSLQIYCQRLIDCLQLVDKYPKYRSALMNAQALYSELSYKVIEDAFGTAGFHVDLHIEFCLGELVKNLEVLTETNISHPQLLLNFCFGESEPAFVNFTQSPLEHFMVKLETLFDNEDELSATRINILKKTLQHILSIEHGINLKHTTHVEQNDCKELYVPFFHFPLDVLMFRLSRIRAKVLDRDKASENDWKTLAQVDAIDQLSAIAIQMKKNHKSNDGTSHHVDTAELLKYSSKKALVSYKPMLHITGNLGFTCIPPVGLLGDVCMHTNGLSADFHANDKLKLVPNDHSGHTFTVHDSSLKGGRVSLKAFALVCCSKDPDAAIKHQLAVGVRLIDFFENSMNYCTQGSIPWLSDREEMPHNAQQYMCRPSLNHNPMECREPLIDHAETFIPYERSDNFMPYERSYNFGYMPYRRSEPLREDKIRIGNEMSDRGPLDSVHILLSKLIKEAHCERTEFDDCSIIDVCIMVLSNARIEPSKILNIAGKDMKALLAKHEDIRSGLVCCAIHKQALICAVRQCVLAHLKAIIIKVAAIEGIILDDLEKVCLTSGIEPQGKEDGSGNQDKKYLIKIFPELSGKLPDKYTSKYRIVLPIAYMIAKIEAAIEEASSAMVEEILDLFTELSKRSQNLKLQSKDLYIYQCKDFGDFGEILRSFTEKLVIGALPDVRELVLRRFYQTETAKIAEMQKLLAPDVRNARNTMVELLLQEDEISLSAETSIETVRELQTKLQKHDFNPPKKISTELLPLLWYEAVNSKLIAQKLVEVIVYNPLEFTHYSLTNAAHLLQNWTEGAQEIEAAHFLDDEQKFQMIHNFARGGRAGLGRCDLVRDFELLTDGKLLNKEEEHYTLQLRSEAVALMFLDTCTLISKFHEDFCTNLATTVQKVASVQPSLSSAESELALREQAAPDQKELLQTTISKEPMPTAHILDTKPVVTSTLSSLAHTSTASQKSDVSIENANNSITIDPGKSNVEMFSIKNDKDDITMHKKKPGEKTAGPREGASSPQQRNPVPDLLSQTGKTEGATSSPQTGTVKSGFSIRNFAQKMKLRNKTESPREGASSPQQRNPVPDLSQTGKTGGAMSPQFEIEDTPAEDLVLSDKDLAFLDLSQDLDLLRSNLKEKVTILDLQEKDTASASASASICSVISLKCTVEEKDFLVKKGDELILDLFQDLEMLRSNLRKKALHISNNIFNVCHSIICYFIATEHFGCSHIAQIHSVLQELYDLQELCNLQEPYDLLKLYDLQKLYGLQKPCDLLKLYKELSSVTEADGVLRPLVAVVEKKEADEHEKSINEMVKMITYFLMSSVVLSKLCDQKITEAENATVEAIFLFRRIDDCKEKIAFREKKIDDYKKRKKNKHIDDQVELDILRDMYKVLEVEFLKLKEYHLPLLYTNTDVFIGSFEEEVNKLETKTNKLLKPKKKSDRMQSEDSEELDDDCEELDDDRMIVGDSMSEEGYATASTTVFITSNGGDSMQHNKTTSGSTDVKGNGMGQENGTEHIQNPITHKRSGSDPISVASSRDHKRSGSDTSPQTLSLLATKTVDKEDNTTLEVESAKPLGLDNTQDNPQINVDTKEKSPTSSRSTSLSDRDRANEQKGEARPPGQEEVSTPAGSDMGKPLEDVGETDFREEGRAKSAEDAEKVYTSGRGSDEELSNNPLSQSPPKAPASSKHVSLSEHETDEDKKEKPLGKEAEDEFTNTGDGRKTDTHEEKRAKSAEDDAEEGNTTLEVEGAKFLELVNIQGDPPTTTNVDTDDESLTLSGSDSPSDNYRAKSAEDDAEEGHTSEGKSGEKFHQTLPKSLVTATKDASDSSGFTSLSNPKTAEVIKDETISTNGSGVQKSIDLNAATDEDKDPYDGPMKKVHLPEGSGVRVISKNYMVRMLFAQSIFLLCSKCAVASLVLYYSIALFPYDGSLERTTVIAAVFSCTLVACVVAVLSTAASLISGMNEIKFISQKLDPTSVEESAAAEAKNLVTRPELRKKAHKRIAITASMVVLIALSGLSFASLVALFVLHIATGPGKVVALVGGMQNFSIISISAISIFVVASVVSAVVHSVRSVSKSNAVIKEQEDAGNDTVSVTIAPFTAKMRKHSSAALLTSSIATALIGVSFFFSIFSAVAEAGVSSVHYTFAAVLSLGFLASITSVVLCVIMRNSKSYLALAEHTDINAASSPRIDDDHPDCTPGGERSVHGDETALRGDPSNSIAAQSSPQEQGLRGTEEVQFSEL